VLGDNMKTNFLHDQIAKIVKISGISLSADNEVTVHFKENPTQEQLDKLNQITSNVPLYFAKYEKYQQIDDNFSKSTNDGFTTSYGWKLGTQLQDITLLSSFFLLAKTAYENNLPLPAIIDTDGLPHTLTIEELTILMLQYGQFRAQISYEYAQKRKAVENATTIEEINNILITN
jgi:hypothetical protein